jgi:hypothetical protein
MLSDASNSAAAKHARLNVRLGLFTSVSRCPLHFRLSPKSGGRSGHRGMSQRCQQEETHAPQQTASLFDHLVGAGQQRRRDINAKHLRGLEVDDGFEFY